MLKGKNAIVTGSTSGIGLGMAEALAGAGVNVMLNGLGDAGEIEQTRSSLEEKYDAKVRFHGADMTKPDQIEDMIETARREFGQIDIMVNNAGIQHVSPVEEFPVGKWDAIIAINLSSAFHTSRLVFGEMKERGWGRVINLASAHGLVASPYKSAYVAAKHGIVLTPLVEAQIPDTAKARGISEEEVKRDVLLAAQPTKEFVTTGQLGALTVFLCTDNAAQINGAALPMDGGWTAQ